MSVRLEILLRSYTWSIGVGAAFRISWRAVGSRATCCTAFYGSAHMSARSAPAVWTKRAFAVLQKINTGSTLTDQAWTLSLWLSCKQHRVVAIAHAAGRWSTLRYRTKVCEATRDDDNLQCWRPFVACPDHSGVTPIFICDGVIARITHDKATGIEPSRGEATKTISEFHRDWVGLRRSGLWTGMTSFPAVGTHLTIPEFSSSGVSIVVQYDMVVAD